MGDVYSFGPFRLLPQARVLQRDGERVVVGTRAFDMLVAMVRRAGEVLSHRELMASAWPNLIVCETNVRVQMAHLRRCLCCGDGADYIINVARRGYSFIAPLQCKSVIPNELMSDGAPRPLPAPMASAVGRDDSQAALSALLRSRRCVTVVGAGGAGKTTLAVLVAHALNEFAGRRVFVDLGVLDRDAAILEAIAGAMGLRVPKDRRVLLDFIAAQHTLVVLDNCEHVIDGAAEFIDQIRARSPRLHVLATSREPLHVQGEVVYLIPPLGTPPATGRLTARQAIQWPAVQLFMDLAARAGHPRELTDDQAPVVAAICRRVDGNPLAIALTASRVGRYTIDGVANLLCNPLALRWQGPRDAVPRHRSAEAVLDWSCGLLSAQHTNMLHRLAEFNGDFSFDAALARAPDGVKFGEAADILHDLIDKSLLSVNATGSTATLRLLDTTRTYATVKLASQAASA